MTERASFYRKIAYLAAFVVLAIFIFWLSTPATANRDGGRLAQLRKEYQLGQANLGEVDPASETMRFLTLGLRGVAVTALWEKANYYKKTEDWTNLTATLEQLAKLQPNFITFWKYQAWNLTYNVSVEFDDYHDRYYYVIRGINFLKEGERYNADNPQLLSDLGWFLGHKIGRADEHVEYRRLFKADPDFHPADRTPDERDNWLVSKEWYQKSIDAIDIKHKSLGGKSPALFYSDPAKSQMSYAEAIEEEGFFDKARRAWTKAGEEWREFGRRPIQHSLGPLLRLGEEPRLTKEVADLRAELDRMDPELRGNLIEEKKQALTADERKLNDTPVAEISATDSEQWYRLQDRVKVSDRDVADRLSKNASADVAKQVLRLVRRLEEAEQDLRYTQSYKHNVNYDFWELRCDYEQTANALAAHELMFRARAAARSADVKQAKQLYHDGFAKFRLVLDEFPALIEEDIVFGDNIVENTKRYRDVLDQLGESLDETYPLWDALEKFDRENVFAQERAKHRQSLPAGKNDKQPQ
ncbi:MAG: hypothetical protein WD669_06790 [Pirellulales bacterium]